ncbi:putative eSX-1 secretion-associated protein EspE [Mycobacterium kansasii]|uniref:Putative eSX-1 secretion-associated protein EspE n=1 Tax=Mycobacterium kansasii TaxID=1768 RepID=A0A1V3WVQ2_MYCKA|nr:putative eSX-1 secretion-associated protein EspE [Mycobacterium kansasii]
MKGSDLCKNTSNFIWGQLLLLGEGIPDPGDVFNSGATLFKQISDKIGLAIPGTNWIGQAADAYLNQNIAQQLRAKVMGDIDSLTGNMISNQAKYVSNTRDVLRAMKKMIDGVYKVCKGLEKVPLLGWLWSWELALPMSGIAMATVGGALLYLTIMTLMNVTNLKGLLGRLIEMLTTLPKFPGLPLPSIPDIIDGLWPPKLPDIPIPGLPNIPGLPDFKWPPVPGIPDFNLPIPGLPEFEWPSIPGLPDFGLPNLPGLPGLPSFPACQSPDSRTCPGCPASPTCSPAYRAWAT